MKNQYYIVIAGLRNANFTNIPVSTPEEASKDAFGIYNPTFRCIPIGNKKPQIDPLTYIVKNGKSLLSKIKNS